MSKNPDKGAESESVVQEQDGGLLNKILESGRLALREDQVDNAKDMLAEFVQQALQGQVVLSKDLESTINTRIAAIDKLLSAQLNEVMHHPDFQKLEGSWRGLKHLVFESETSTMLKIRVLNVSKKDLLKDLERAAARRTPATWGSPSPTPSCVSRTARTPFRSSLSISRRTWTARTTRSTSGETPPTRSGRA